jgi:DNA-binding NtrC family response regulator
MTKQQAPYIFVVDDEKTISETLAAILCGSGFNAVSFTNPLAAIESAHWRAPDLLISDVVMLELSGIDLAILVKRRYPRCKILLFSGQADTDDLLKRAREGGYEFNLLAKPLHPTALLREIEKQDSTWLASTPKPSSAATR